MSERTVTNGKGLLRATRTLELADRLTIACVELDHLPWSNFKSEVRRVEADLLCATKGSREALLLKRLVAEEIVGGGLQREVSTKEFTAAFEESRSLGYTKVERRAFMACQFAQWAKATKKKEDEALRLLDEARRRVLSLPGKSVLRRNLLAMLTDTEQYLAK
jgi:hypothetical protein